jgi:ABC-type glutathione transport system ATPase component
MKRITINALVDIACLITFVPSLVTGLVLYLFLPEGGFRSGWATYLGIPRNQWVMVHNSTSLVFAALLIIHLLLHQEYDLYPHRTVLDNLTDAIGLAFPKELAKRKALITLRMAGFTDEKSLEILNRYPGELSNGERHRVALAQVLIHEPRLVILDEPTGTMDPITKQDVKHSILNARDEMDETFIVVSHDMDFVKDTCDRVALMRRGKIIQMGKTDEILASLNEEERSREA